MKTLYFAYGSNMYTPRFSKRVPSGTLFGIGYIRNRKIVFNKQSKDGSGKANLVEAIGEITWGVLYEVNTTDLEKLDRIEGGYSRMLLEVYTNNSKIPVNAFVYVSNLLTNEDIAYDWYKDLIVLGGEKHRLPPSYIEYLKKMPAKPSS